MNRTRPVKVQKKGRHETQEDYPTTKMVGKKDWKTTLHLLTDYAIDIE